MSKRIGRMIKTNVGWYFTMLYGFGIAAVVMRQYLLGGVELGVTTLLLIGHIMYRSYRRGEFQSFVQQMEATVTGATGDISAPFPTVLFRMADKTILYANESFSRLTGLRDTFKEHRVDEFLPGFDVQWLLSGNTEYTYDMTLEERRYRVYGTMVRVQEGHGTQLGMLYLTDLTELYQVRDEYIRSRPVVSIILVDNYEELTRNMSEAAISSLNAQINNAIMKWTQNYHGLLRRLEKNRFLLVFEKRDLKQAMDSKFTILEDIHAITAPSGLAASISFGLGVDGATFEEGYEFAALSIEMALSRGGDQAVVKDRMNFSFYGGRTKEADHRSKVRSRVTANSLMELIAQSSQVFIMGHKFADMDSVGAAMGVACLCRKKGKPFRIVLDLEKNASKKLLDEILQDPVYKGAFISGQDAQVMCDSRSTLVVVDTNRPDQVEFQPLLESITKICVIDHHRRAADYIKPVVVNFHEPYASSASELVTELLEYAVERKDVLPIEVKSLMAGIFLDTKSFNVRTGERTFEAAAHLRQLGADTVEVKMLLQNDFQTTVAKYSIIKAARMYRDDIAIAALNTTPERALAAQAADELLNISGITTSFVLYPDGDQVIISARAIGSTNVQMILEPLGGGGNAATAGCQVKGMSVREVLDRLVASIDQYFES